MRIILIFVFYFYGDLNAEFILLSMQILIIYIL